MPEELGDGLYLAGIGMGLVFVALVVFLLILLALRRFFPGEEVPPESQGGSGSPVVEMAEADQAGQASAATGLASPPATPVGPDYGKIPGARIAAVAVATYLAMEQEEHPQQDPIAPVQETSSPSHSTWGDRGRAAILDSQGHRPPAYGQRPRSPHAP
jgi:Na+-transporting methylmalonyl-CoA/oxaloacetate decarboxylase gamma subunit